MLDFQLLPYWAMLEASNCLRYLARMLPHRLRGFHEALTYLRARVEIVDGVGRMVGGGGGPE